MPIDDANLDPTAPLAGGAYTDAAAAYDRATGREYQVGIAVCGDRDGFPAVSLTVGDTVVEIEPGSAEMLWQALGNALRYATGQPPEDVTLPA